ncbi:MAG: hypothetical protein II393_04530 [Cytophagales bacterium]|nr:hypothetical protein [Cytophagales bacterium]
MRNIIFCVVVMCSINVLYRGCICCDKLYRSYYEESDISILTSGGFIEGYSDNFFEYVPIDYSVYDYYPQGYYYFNFEDPDNVYYKNEPSKIYQIFCNSEKEPSVLVSDMFPTNVLAKKAKKYGIYCSENFDFNDNSQLHEVMKKLLHKDFLLGAWDLNVGSRDYDVVQKGHFLVFRNHTVLLLDVGGPLLINSEGIYFSKKYGTIEWVRLFSDKTCLNNHDDCKMFTLSFEPGFLGEEKVEVSFCRKCGRIDSFIGCSAEKEKSFLTFLKMMIELRPYYKVFLRGGMGELEKQLSPEKFKLALNFNSEDFSLAKNIFCIKQFYKVLCKQWGIDV